MAYLCVDVLCGCFQHGDFVPRHGTHNQIELTLGHLFAGRIGDHLTINKSYADGGDGPYILCPRDIGDSQCRRGGVDAQHLRVVDAIRRHYVTDDLRLVKVAVGKERAN